ncbi:myo-inositol 2-dehydrogenase / D-chiro-inositol 1-dehydrogenase [Humidesulfovibrio mexicanus]|uniref:Myo-inositol 2-dehydrogenase / D-chiro-inositol 1-dehydrogenase n=1 Tax=Humidesulfovibrio mexicanus TaxID=147047 RepID=A0A239BW38_9BACT|nr:Gfo/Idh/MocA family oxidoreductase [Humidesulfovibrio mexicanus]SNS11648.1 myo-inositol 2-dehydrogenase / D-chiro-inositol 1-dehydrogenase [Humidesulfovibrio mexicanus]
MAGAPHGVVLLGCGGIGYRFGRGRNGLGALSHLHAILAQPRLRLLGVADPDPATRAEIARLYGLPAFATAQELFSACPAQAAIIAAPDRTHPELLRLAAAQDLRAVLCEKPLAGSLAEAEELVGLLERAGAALCVNYSRRFLPEYADMRRRMAAGELGRLESLLVYYSRGFRHNASHYLDLLLWWLGEPERVRMDGKRPGITPEDPTVSVTLAYADGLEARLVGLSDGVLRINEIDVIGTRGRLTLDTLGALTHYSPAALPDYPGLTAFTPDAPRQVALDQALPNAAAHLADVLDGAALPVSTGRDSLALHRLMDRILMEDTQ